jgi:dipeptidyl aminopeptidase/acylaminoacyl peptidase
VLDVSDLWAIRSARETRIDPEGRRVAFCVIGLERERDRERSELHVVEVDAGRELWPGCAAPTGQMPRWSPDGRWIAYLADDEGARELHLLDVAAGTSSALASLPGSPRAAVWSPDGRRLALQASEPPGGSRIAIIDVSSGVVELLPGPAEEADGVPSWSPDSTRLAFARSRTGSNGAMPRSSICVARIGGAEEPTVLSRGLAFAGCPSWSPGGEMLACVGTAEPRLGPNDPCLQPWIIRVSDGSARLAASGVAGVVVPPNPEGPCWTPDERRILFLEARRGDVNIASASVASPRGVDSLTRGLHVIDFSASCDTTMLAFTASTGSVPPAPYLHEDGRGRPLLPARGASTGSAETSAAAPQHRSFRSPHGHSLDGWLQGLDRGRSPQPLLVGVHGGPHGFIGSGFNLGHFYRYVLASRGWLVMTLNATGSGSYGADFADAIRGRWGEYDLPEHLEAIDELTEQGLVDPDRVVIAGYSYGGYLAAWAVCMDDRFRGAVIGAPITNLESFECTSDIGSWYAPWEMGGGLPENAELYRRLSPVSHAERIAAPVLILHGEADRRCPVGQSLEFRERVEAAGRAAVELVRYPNADHLFYAAGRPSQRIDFNQRIVTWVEKTVEEGSR